MSSLILCVLGVAVLAQAQATQIEITFNNRTQYQLSMYVDGNFGCTANPGMTCDSTADTKAHLLDARLGQNIVTQTQEPAVDHNYTYTVCRADDNSGPCKSD
ncbi:MAG: hypothetical protein ACLP1Y_13575 [Candidatus Acidiferrales bacterium]